jgi:zinc protease
VGAEYGGPCIRVKIARAAFRAPDGGKSDRFRSLSRSVLVRIHPGELRRRRRSALVLLLLAPLAATVPPQLAGGQSPSTSLLHERTTPEAAASDPEPGVVRFTLDNGLTVLVLPQGDLSLVNVTMVYSVGGAHEEAGITGLAHYVEHMAFRSTENISNVDLTGIIERIGGRWNGYTTLDRTLYGATVPAWALESVLEIEAERMTRVRWDEEEFERERTSVIAELQGGENAAAVLRERVNAHAFELHPYRTGVIGRITDLLDVSVQEGERFYRDYYGPNNAVLAVVGDVDPDRARHLVERHFGSTPPAPRSTEIRVVEPPQLGEKRLEITYPAQQSYLRIAFHAPAVVDPEYPTLMLLDALLTHRGGILQPGGSALPGSRLQRVVAEAGGGGVATSFAPTRYPALYTISVEVSDSSRVAAVKNAVYEELDRVARGLVSPDELEAARRSLRDGARFESTDLRETAHRLAVFELLGDWEMAGRLEGSATNRSIPELMEYASTWFQPRGRTVGIHRPGPLPVARIAVPPPSVEPLHLPRPSPIPLEALRPLPDPGVEIATAQLPTGTRLAAARHEGPVAALHLRLGFGSRSDPHGREGLAILAGRLILEHPALDDLRRRRGVRIQSSVADPYSMANRDHLDLSIRFLPEHRSQVIAAIVTALSDLAPDPERVEDIRARQVGQRARLEDDARWRAQEAVLQHAVEGWIPPLGTPGSLAAMAEEDLHAFLVQNLKGGWILLALASPGAPGEILRELGEALGAVRFPEPDGQAATTSTPERPGAGARDQAPTGAFLIPLEGESRAAIAAALPAVDRGHPDHLPLLLLNYILGETGYAGRLGDALVRSGLAYSVYSVPAMHLEDGAILVRTSTAATTTDEVLDAIQEVFARVGTEGVETWEIEEAKAFRLGRMLADLEASDSLARLLIDDLFHERPLLNLPARSAEILEVAPTHVQEAARRHFTVESLGLAAAGAVPARTNGGLDSGR